MAGKQGVLRRILPALTALLLTLLISGCGKVTDTSGLAGLWVLEDAGAGSIALPDSLIHGNRLTLRLDPDGGGVVKGEQSEGRIRWQYEEGQISLQTGTVKLLGTVDRGVILLQPESGEMLLRFIPADAELSEEASDEGLPVDPAGQPEAGVLGDWYGWWKIENSTGSMPVTWYDCCASFEACEDGTIRMILWDEDGSRSDPLSEIVFSVLEERLASLNGYFANAEVLRGEWSLPSPTSEVYIPDIRHQAGEESFTASVYLRPWGDRWSDTPEEQRPFYYEDWYLPLLEQNASMPDEIPWRDLEEKRTQPVGTMDAPFDRS